MLTTLRPLLIGLAAGFIAFLVLGLTWKLIIEPIIIDHQRITAVWQLVNQPRK